MKFPRQANLWLPSFLRDRASRLNARPAKRLWVALTDHYEPMGGKASLATGLERVRVWQDRWPAVAAAAPRDASGRQPCFTFFYPQEEYRYEILAALAEMARSGTTDVEVHLHHDHDTADQLRQKLTTFLAQLRNDHGLLHHHHGRPVFGFIHGNWALDNSRPDGRWCGVQGELQLLRDLGCYADFTMPSLPSPTQSRIVNKIYWTTGDPATPRGFDRGVIAAPGGGTQGDLLMITGPVGLRFTERLIPRLETGELAAYDLPTTSRVERWLKLAPRIGDDLFLKLYGHSAREDNAEALLGSDSHPGGLATLFQSLHRTAQQHNLELHWASAFEMFEAVDALLHTAPAAQPALQGTARDARAQAPPC